MKIAIVGFYNQDIYEEAFAKGLENSGAQIVRVDLKSIWRPLFPKFSASVPSLEPKLKILNNKVVDYILSSDIDKVLFWRPTHITSCTLVRLNKLNIQTISYNNDDPFHYANSQHKNFRAKLLWRNYLKALPHFDYNFFYRQINCNEATNFGAKHVSLLLPYFIPGKNKNVLLAPEEKTIFGADVVFVGHYEADGRDESLMSLLTNEIDVKIWGGKTWNKSALMSQHIYKRNISSAVGHDYEKALCGAKVCLAFLSSLNRDTYTRRCFEIPACKKVLLAPRTADLTTMFKEGVEACFFENNNELLQKVHWLLEHNHEREKIAQAGFERVWKLGASVNDRARQFLKEIR